MCGALPIAAEDLDPEWDRNRDISRHFRRVILSTPTRGATVAPPAGCIVGYVLDSRGFPQWELEWTSKWGNELYRTKLSWNESITQKCSIWMTYLERWELEVVNKAACGKTATLLTGLPPLRGFPWWHHTNVSGNGESWDKVEGKTGVESGCA